MSETTNETLPAVIESAELAAVAQVAEQEGLEHQKANMYVQAFGPFMAKFGELEPQINAINATEPTLEDSKNARTLRLQYLKNRTGAEDKKKNLKSGMLIEGRLVDNLFNVVKSASELKERYLKQIEDYAEIQESKRRTELQSARLEQLSQYGYKHNGFDLSTMDEDAFQALLSGTKAAYDAKIEAEAKAKAEVERQLTIKKLREARTGLLAPFAQFVPQEKRMINLGELSEEDFTALMDEIAVAKKAYDDEQEQIRQENARLKAEADAKAKQLALERAQAAAKEKAQREAAEMEKRKQDALLKAEKEKADRLANELKKQQEAALEKQKQEAARLEAEKKAAEAAERKAQRAPDKNKLEIFAEAISKAVNGIPVNFKSPEASAIYFKAVEDINIIINRIKSDASEL